jgi:Fe-S-cluster containining protein
LASPSNFKEGSKALIENWAARVEEVGFENEQKYKLSELEKIPEADLARHGDARHGQVFQQLDCLDCANCCKSIPPIITQEDASRIAARLEMNPGLFMAEYVVFDEDDDMVINSSPCPFLEEDNRCRIYEDRPEACRKYPHTDGAQLVEHFDLLEANVQYCPATYWIVERLHQGLIANK